VRGHSYKSSSKGSNEKKKRGGRDGSLRNCDWNEFKEQPNLDVLTARLHCRICLHLLFALLSIDCQNFVPKENKNHWKSRVLDALRVPVWHWHSKARGLHVFVHCLIAFLSKSFCNPLYDTNGRGVIKCKSVYQLTHSLKRCQQRGHGSCPIRVGFFFLQ
jgi:hypothetical protein